MTAGLGKERHGLEVQNPSPFSGLPVTTDSVAAVGSGSLDSAASRQPNEV